jgi:pyruvate formate lyase activating enzyme
MVDLMGKQQTADTGGTVFNIQRFSLHDGPGIRTTVFLKGCPLRCRWCQNPEGLTETPELMYSHERCTGCGTCAAVCPAHAITMPNHKATISARCNHCGACVQTCPVQALEMSGRNMPASAVVAELASDAVFYEESGGGITLSGGEPLAQPAFAMEILRQCKESGFHTAVDTSGYAEPDLLKAVRPFVDLFLYDIKLVDEEAHKLFTGVSNRLILDNLKTLCAAGSEVIVRYPLIPGINDDPETARAIGRQIAEYGIAKIQVLPYHTFGSGKRNRLFQPKTASATPPKGEAQTAKIMEILGKFDFETTLGG